MKAFSLITCAILFFSNYACSKKTGSGSSTQPVNHSPVASLIATIQTVNPFTIDFKLTASDEDHDVLTYRWDFGEGTIKSGGVEETFTYPENKSFTIKVAVTDGESQPANVNITVNTTVTAVQINDTEKFQIMEGFGGFGAKDAYWTSGPFTSPDFVNSLVNDLGLTILRDNIPTDFEAVNDNNDPFNTDLSKFDLSTSIKDHFQYLKDMKAAGLNKLIVSAWSAPAWMKTNNNVNGLAADAPAYNPNPTAQNNQLRTDMYDEFAERCVAYIKIIKQQTGIDIYAISLQNEPRFTEPYESCVFNGEALKNLIKVAGKRFKDEGLATKILMPEDIGYLDGVSGMVQPALNDADARQYVNIIAVHGYALDGVTADSPDALTWKTMNSWGAQYNMPLWMTETSGLSNDMTGAMDLGKAMYTAITFGNVSAWLHWALSTETLDKFSLMSSAGTKSKRYYVSKNFYRYVRPGDIRIEAIAAGESTIYPLAFKNDTAHTHTIILINDNAESRAVNITGTSLPSAFSLFTTSASADCKDYGIVNTSSGFLLPPNSVSTLYNKN